MKKLLTFSLILLTGCLAKTEKTLVELEKGEGADIPKVISIKMKQFRPTPGRLFKEIFVSNFSTKVSRGRAEDSSSRDSLSDALKSQTSADYGFSAGSPNSTNPYFSDLMIYLSGIRFAQQNFLHCAASLRNSKSDDIIKYIDSRSGSPVLVELGLRDCEKSYLGLKPDLFDFDKDGIPDYLELRCGMNPRNGNDAALSPVGDNISYLEKCKRHIPIDENADSYANKLYGYNYKIEIEQDGTKTFHIDNIPVLKNDAQNLIIFYIVEMDPSTARTYLFTAYTLLTPEAGRTAAYEFDYWVVPGNIATYTNQEVTF